MPDRPATDLTKPPEERIFDPNETQLGSPLNRGQYNRDFRNMLITNSILRNYELGREAKRNMAAAKQYLSKWQVQLKKQLQEED